MKKVLIALDYDPTLQKVAEGGFEFSRTLGAKVILMWWVLTAGNGWKIS